MLKIEIVATIEFITNSEIGLMSLYTYSFAVRHYEKLLCDHNSRRAIQRYVTQSFPTNLYLSALLGQYCWSVLHTTKISNLIHTNSNVRWGSCLNTIEHDRE